MVTSIFPCLPEEEKGKPPLGNLAFASVFSQLFYTISGIQEKNYIKKRWGSGKL